MIWVTCLYCKHMYSSMELVCPRCGTSNEDLDCEGSGAVK
jgi:RNA polymerase subunit RPABC4/transcription elongation factor Spt4